MRLPDPSTFIAAGASAEVFRLGEGRVLKLFHDGIDSSIVAREYVDKVDHKNFNLDVPFMQGTIPTTENVVLACWQILEPALRPARLTRLRLWETENNCVEYDGNAGTPAGRGG